MKISSPEEENRFVISSQTVEDVIIENSSCKFLIRDCASLKSFQYFHNRKFDDDGQSHLVVLNCPSLRELTFEGYEKLELSVERCDNIEAMFFKR